MKKTKPCPVCGTRFAYTREDHTYCKQACRQRANRARKRHGRERDTRTLTGLEMLDVGTLRAKGAHEAADTVIRLSALYGADVGREILDALWALMGAIEGA